MNKNTEGRDNNVGEGDEGEAMNKSKISVKGRQREREKGKVAEKSSEEERG